MALPSQAAIPDLGGVSSVRDPPEGGKFAERPESPTDEAGRLKWAVVTVRSHKS